MYYPRFTKVIIHYFLTKDKTVSRRNKIGMHTSRDEYLINTLRFIFANEVSQIYRARLPESMTSPKMRETKAYKTYLGYATGVTSPKKARKFKKPASPKLKTVPASPKEPIKKLKRVKRPAKMSTTALTTSVIIRDTHGMSVSKKKASAKTNRDKGIELLSDATLIEDAQLKKALKKSRQEIQKLQASGSRVPDVSKEESTESEAESWGRDEDESNNDHDSSSEGSDQENDSDEEEIEDDEDEINEESKVEDDEDKGMDYTTNQFDDDVDVRLNNPVHADEGYFPHRCRNYFASVFQFNNRFSVLEKEVSKLKKDDPLNTQVTALVDKHLDSRLGATKEEFTSYLSASITARITKQVKIQLPQILPKEVSNFAPLVIQSMVTESLEHAVLAKESSQPQLHMRLECYDGLLKSYDLDKSLFSTYDKAYSMKRSQEDKDKDEDPFVGSDQGLKKRKTSKDAEPTKGLKTKESKSSSSKGTNSQSKSSRKYVQAEEPEFEVADSDMPQNQEGNLGNDDEEPIREVASKRDWFTKSKQPQEPTDMDWNVGKTPKQGPTQSWLMTLVSTADKSSKTFDELMSTPIDFSAYIINGLNITNLT
ncbi:hypothetical protein Tco_0953865 [Tanacetum coccineum]|uniref:Uncharacterized protein n=1 Tax=Tanacetum coccineum TaxID=301880 RepID=A0ABQ5E139_9ASTR